MTVIDRIHHEKIRLDGGTQPRAKISEEVYQEYAEQMKAGKPFPPVTVYFDGKNYWLADGFHRYYAHKLVRPDDPLECEVFQGSVEDAQWFSYGVNKTHGLRRTNGDKERAVRAALAHTRAITQSNYQVAEHCGVSDFMVRKYRRSATAIKSQSDLSPDAVKTSRAEKELKRIGIPSRRRISRDGRTINTARIGEQQAKAGKKNKKTNKLSHRANIPFRKHSEPLRLIPVQFCPDNPHTAAATLIQLFPRTFLEGIVQEINQHLNQTGESS